mmetsp:Transcript_7465/g.21165  ORF Transcript_7465/g.21165 Transcript_7465/m.21165 type:complete len:1029 (-) Transcript_7465:106-3192(-)
MWLPAAGPGHGAKDCNSTPDMVVAAEVAAVSSEKRSGEEHFRFRRQALHFVRCFLANGVVTALAIGLWSSMGVGRQLFHLLDRGYDYSAYPVGLAVLILLVMYMFDLFLPPQDSDRQQPHSSHATSHHSDQRLLQSGSGEGTGRASLQNGDRQMLRSRIGKVLFAIACILFLASCVLLQRQYPYLPLLITILMTPLSTAVARRLAPHPESEIVERAEEILSGEDLLNKIHLLTAMVHLETDARDFYLAACLALVSNFFVAIVPWLVWAFGLRRKAVNKPEHTDAQQEVLVILWLTPVAVAISNLVFSLFILFRFYMQRTYVNTDENRNQLVVDFAQLPEDREAQEALALARQSVKTSQTEGIQACEEVARRYSGKHKKSFQTLLVLMKVAMCTFVVLLGGLYVAFQVLYTNSSIANMVLGLMAAFFLVFVVFMYFSFRRVVMHLGKTVKELPAFQMAKSLTRSPWARALLLCFFLPCFPFVAALSFVNQLVRKARGVYARSSKVEPAQTVPDDIVAPVQEFDAEDDRDGDDGGLNSNTMTTIAISAAGFGNTRGSLATTAGAGSMWGEADSLDPAALRLTPRVHAVMVAIRKWDWLAVASKVYILCLLHVAYNVAPPLTNVGLSWMRRAVAHWPFEVIVLMTFAGGVVAFLCPVVPGLTVYIFGGMVISNTCPPVGTDRGFWTGSMINIVLCFCLKLCACAVQQKCIGQLLGSRLWVRQQVGVHKVAIRCIESIMSKRGWTIGKVAILCGGPDWPVSVLAGVLGLSLVQCEIGTLPIIFFVAPCAMSGSLYLQVGRSDLWTRSASLMMLCAIGVNFFLWALAGWAIQNELEQNLHQLSRRLRQNVELEWLDYREAELKKLVAFAWKDVAVGVRSLYLFGAVLHILVCHSMTFIYSSLISNFQVSDDINRLEWLSDTFFHSGGVTDSDQKIVLFSRAAIVAMCIYTGAWMFYLVFAMWKRSRVRNGGDIARKDLDSREAAWKAAWLLEVEEEHAREAMSTSEPEKECDRRRSSEKLNVPYAQPPGSFCT